MRVLLFFMLGAFLIGEASAQNRSIEFRKDEWKKYWRLRNRKIR